MKARKSVIVIVEGLSDETVMSYFLPKIYDPSFVRVHVYHGDITTDRQSTPGSIIRQVNKCIKYEMKLYGLRKTDVLRAIHVMDTDGAFVPDEAVKESADVPHTLYSCTEITTNDRESILARNQQKRANMTRLATTHAIGGIPYLPVYMSCNLDHVLHDKQNNDDDAKGTDAQNFVIRYNDDVPGFVRFMCESDFSVAGDQKESWEFIAEGLHSLERHTNFGLCVRGV